MFCIMSSCPGQPPTGTRLAWCCGIKRGMRGSVVVDEIRIILIFQMGRHQFLYAPEVAKVSESFRYPLPYRLRRNEGLDFLIRSYIK